MSRTRLAVWDLDGVLADVRHRLHHVMCHPKDWDAFFAAAPSDPVLEAGLHLQRQQVEGGLTVAYLSGRPERCRADTTEWISRHRLATGEVYLRPHRDYRPARVVKLEHLRRLAREHDIVEVIDDDPEVVAALTAAGFPVRHATWMHDAGSEGPDAQALWDAQEREGRT